MNKKSIKSILKLNFSICIIFLLSIIIRICFLDVKGPDYNIFLQNWYNEMMQNGIFSLKNNISNYPDSYMFLLSIGTYITENSLLYIKVLSIIFDYIIYIYIYKIFNIFNVNNSKLKALLITFLPTIFINSSILGQCDAIYISFIMMFIYYILKDKKKTALVLFGVAISFKIQTLFIAPIFLYILLTKKIKLYDIIFVFCGFFIFFIPTQIFGKGILENIKILLHQMDTYNVFVKSCPNIYSLVCLNYKSINIFLKFIITVIVIVLTVFISKKETKIGFKKEIFLEKILILSLFVPYFLPSMLDRYFYLANIMIYIYYIIFNNSKSLRYIILSSIAFSLPTISINFFNNLLFDYIFVTVISSSITLYIIINIFKQVLNKDNESFYGD